MLLRSLILIRIIFKKNKKKTADSFQKNLIYLGCASNIEKMSSVWQNLNIKFENINVIENSDQLILDIINLLRENSNNYIFISKDYYLDEYQLSQISHLHGKGASRIFIESRLLPLAGKLSIVNGEQFLEINEPRIVDSGIAAKRIFDILFSVITIILLLPLMITIAVAIKLTSPGPVFYISQRVGKDNILFKFPKFRSMYQGSDNIRDQVIGLDQSIILEKYKRDTRITPVGKFIRRWSIDELPQ